MTGRFLGVGATVLLAVVCGAPAAAQVSFSQGGGTYSLQVVSYRDIPFRTVVRQEYDYSCGSAALATLLRYHYGRDVAEHEVFLSMYENGDRQAIERVGFSLLDMKRYLDSHGFQADGFRMTLAALEEAHAAGAPVPLLTINSVGPTLMRFGTEDQKEGMEAFAGKGRVLRTSLSSEQEAKLAEALGAKPAAPAS